MIRVVVAEDSVTVRELLVAMLEAEGDISVVGQASTGAEAIELATKLRPDLITMDIDMPVMSGLEATKEIMVRAPTPIIIVSASARPEAMRRSFDSIRAGALMLLEKPENPGTPQFGARRTQLVTMVRAMADVKVVRRYPHDRTQSPPIPPPPHANVRVVAMAASTGGPVAVQRILSELPRDFPAPILLVQHIGPGFTQGFADWLAGACDLHVRIAQPNETARARYVYLAPDDRHLAVSEGGTIQLRDAPPLDGHRPSANVLFESAAHAFGPAVAAVILTGMGRDGVEGLFAVRQAGGRVLAQDEATCVVYGMPREAVCAGVVDVILPLDQMAPYLTNLTLGGEACRGGS
jgi:two-component system, chemotaxis family, protein-glutamate methylesterase/glutaminase